ncbi:sulfite exporter TauE/SafE family protein [Halovulum sp. GXIMD14793]
MEYDTGLLIALALGLAATGSVAGVLAGLLGVGGGIVIVPVLFQLFDFLEISPSVAMHLAVGTSLATIIPTSISSARSHHARGAIDISLLRRWAPTIFLGALAGGVLSKYLDGTVLTEIFGGIALIVSINMVLPRPPVLAESLPENRPANAAISGGIGGFSALMGIGGGTLSVPILTLFSFPVHRAVGTASAFGLVIAVPAVCGFIWAGWGAPDRPPLSLGYVNLAAAVVIFTLSVVTAPLGARLAHAINPRHLRLAFAVFLGLTALRMLWKVLN